MSRGESGKRHFANAVVGMGILVAVLIIVSGYLFSQTVTVGISGAKDAYQAVFAEVSGQTAEKYYVWAFDKGERDYHTSNAVAISLEGFREQANLEVLQASDVEFVVHDGDDFKVWLSIPGNGVFTVDLALGEFLVDDVRRVVVARLPGPKLSACEIDKKNIEMFELDNGGIFHPFNGTYAKGEELAQSHLAEGARMIQEELGGNQMYQSSAEHSAERIVTELIQGMNPGIEDLKVVVEFLD